MPDDPADLGLYDAMVSKALERLTRWAFQGSQLERKDPLHWLLWHISDEGKKYVDVSVELRIKKGKPESFLIADSVQPRLARLTRENLEDELRIAVCSMSE